MTITMYDISSCRKTPEQIQTEINRRIEIARNLPGGILYSQIQSLGLV